MSATTKYEVCELIADILRKTEVGLVTMMAGAQHGG